MKMNSSSLLPSKAATYLGTKDRPNTFTKWYAAKVKNPAYLDAPWCAMFASYVSAQLGFQDLTGQFAYCPYWVSWLKDKGLWGSKPAVGALVFFDWNRDGRADHVGIVESIHGNRIYTIEGNTGGGEGKVLRQDRSLYSVMGFGLPKYPSVKPAKTYTVKKGDTLIGIAKVYYGDPEKWKVIYNANKKVIGKNPAMIKPGQKLSLP
jgi:hypothetical protein